MKTTGKVHKETIKITQKHYSNERDGKFAVVATIKTRVQLNGETVFEETAKPALSNVGQTPLPGVFDWLFNTKKETGKPSEKLADEVLGIFLKAMDGAKIRTG